MLLFKFRVKAQSFGAVSNSNKSICDVKICKITKKTRKTHNLTKSAAAGWAGFCNAIICPCAPAGGTDFLPLCAFTLLLFSDMRSNNEIVAVRVSCSTPSKPCKQRIRELVFKALPNRRHIEYGGGYTLVVLLQPEKSIHLSRSIAEQLAKSIAVLTLVERCSVQLPSREVVVETKIDPNGTNSKSWCVEAFGRGCDQARSLESLISFALCIIMHIILIRLAIEPLGSRDEFLGNTVVSIIQWFSYR